MGIIDTILLKGLYTSMKYFLLFLLLLLNLMSTEIKSIQFKGLIHLSAEVASEIFAVKVGSELDEIAINEGIKKLFKQEYFKEISVEENGGDLVVIFKEKSVISAIKVFGFKESDSEKQAEIIQLKKGQLYDKKKVEAAKNRILAYLEQDGAIDSVVEVEVITLANDSVELDIYVNPGKEITITSLILEGASKIDPDKLTDIMANNEAQSFGWWFGRHNGELKLPELKIDPLRMADVYRQNGFLDIEVKPPLLRVDFNSYDAQLSYEINEGIQYKVDKVSFSGNGDIASDAVIEKLIHMKEGKIFDINVARKDMDRIKLQITSKGYAFAKVNPNLPRDKKNETVDVDYLIIPGEKVYIRDVMIVGNDRTLDRVIRRDVYLAPGDLYSGRDLEQSRNALKRTGAFTTATIEEKRVSMNEMDIIVHVKEAPTGNIQVGGGYGDYNGLSFDASVSDRNIFGSGINAGLNFKTSRFTKSYSINFSNPRLNDSDYSGSMSLYIREFELEDTYRTKSSGVSLSTGKRFTRTFSGSVGYNFASTSFPFISPDAALTQEQIQAYEKSSVTFGLRFDDTDDFYVPRKGVKLSNNIEVAGLGGEAKFFKDSISFAAFHGFRDSYDIDVVVRFKSQLRWIKDHGFVPLDQNFFMGGLGSVRGYDQYSFPTYVDDDNNASTALVRDFYAQKMLTNSLEFSFPLVDAAKLRLAFFADYGFLGENDFSQEERGGYGAQIEWFSPLGPIALIFARAFNNEEGDRLNSFEFSIGRPF